MYSNKPHFGPPQAPKNFGGFVPKIEVPPGGGGVSAYPRAGSGRAASGFVLVDPYGFVKPSGVFKRQFLGVSRHVTTQRLRWL